MARITMLLVLGALALALPACHAVLPIEGYTSYATLSAANAYTVSWRIESTNIFIALQATTTGFMGFGLGEPTSGSMPGADILVAGVDTLGAGYVQDRYAVAKVTPSIDTTQDWTLVNSSAVGGVITVHAMRALNTGNIYEDRPFASGPLKIIWALGPAGGDFLYHSASRGTTSISFFGTPIVDLATLSGVPEEYIVSNFSIPVAKKTYACQGWNIRNSGTTRHIIAFEPLIAVSTQKYVHHIVFHACSSATTWFNQYLSGMSACDSPVGNTATGCTEVFWMWAVGAGPLILPENVGARIGTGGITRIVLQFHYDNPSHDAGQVDQSGFRMWTTTELRTYESSVITIGDPYAAGGAAGGSGIIPAGQSSYAMEFVCSSECTSSLAAPITVIASGLHMHSVGKQIWTSHYRGSSLVRISNKIEYWDFAFQEMTPLTPYQILAGDRLSTHCIFDTSASATDVTFGSDSAQEMCMDFIMYYPKITNYPYCGQYSTYKLCGANVPQPAAVAATLAPDPLGQEIRVFGNAAAWPSSTGSSVTTTSSTGSASTGSVSSASSTASSVLSSTATSITTYPLTINGVVHAYTGMESISDGMVLYWLVSGNNIDIALRRRNTGWLAFGFGMNMVGSYAFIGWKSGSTSNIDVYSLAGQSTSSVQPLAAMSGSAHYTSKEVDSTDGYITIRVSRPLAVSSPAVSISTTGVTQMIFAYASSVPSGPTTVLQHSGYSQASVSFGSSSSTSSTAGSELSGASSSSSSSVVSLVSLVMLAVMLVL